MQIQSVGPETTVVFKIVLTTQELKCLKEEMDLISDQFDGKARSTVPTIYELIEGTIQGF